MHLGNASLWKQETLDSIPKPDRSKPRPKREKNSPAHLTPPTDIDTPDHISKESVSDEQAKNGEKSSVDCSDLIR
jgi:hypothetical protein